MKSNKNILLVFLLLAFVVFNVMAFVIPSSFTTSFWISYIFSLILFIVLLLIVLLFDKFTSLKKGTFPPVLSYYTGIYSIIQCILFFVTKFVFNFPSWLSIVLNVLILGIFGYLFLSICFVSNNSYNFKSKVNKKEFYLKNLQVDVELLAEKESNQKTKDELNKLAEKLRFSDPMSNEILEEIERKLKETIENLKETDKKDILIEKANNLLSERNKKVKILKSNG